MEEIVQWLVENMDSTPFGDVNLTVSMHDGHIVSVTKSVTEKRKVPKKGEKTVK